MGIVLALALSLVHPAVEAQPHLLDAALQPPVTLAGSGGEIEKGVLWRVLGVPAGAGLGFAAGSMIANSLPTKTDGSLNTLGAVVAIVATGAGAYGGYVVGDVADEGDGLARIGIGTTCVLEAGAAGLLFLVILALSGMH